MLRRSEKTPVSSLHRAGLVVAAWALLSSEGAAAPVDKQACVMAHEQTQEARLAGKLRLAREFLQTCSKPGCPPLVRNDCAGWQAEIEREQPSLKIRVRGADGAELKGFSVLIDGEPAVITPAGEYLLDPGDHALRVELPGHPAHERRIEVKAQQQGVAVEIQLVPRAAASSAPPASAPGRSLTAPLLLGGLGLVGVGVFAYFGLTGKADEDRLKACKPVCPQGDVDAVSGKYLVANVGLGVGAVALGVATYLLLRRPPEPVAASRAQVTPWVSAGLGGALVTGRFLQAFRPFPAASGARSRPGGGRPGSGRNPSRWRWRCGCP